MADQLLIRAYNIGCGDCLYVRIPDPNDGFHILIDCGKKGGTALLEKAVRHLESELPPGSQEGKKRLDLIVATHRHEDHIKGFDPRYFANIEVKNVWLSVAMDPKNPQAEGVRALHAFAGQAMRGLMESGLPLDPEIELLASLYGVCNDAADRLLMETLPRDNGIEPTYVSAGMAHGLSLPPDTAIQILAPEVDIDHYYLGEELDTSLKVMRGMNGTSVPSAGPEHAEAPSATSVASVQPANISATDFRVLQSRMLSNGLAFAAKDTSIQNNLSVVLLIEWKKRRLLFVGDAEWEGEFRAGKHNGSWNVMWEKHRHHLGKPLDFLKIGHHGSINATPPAAEDRPAKAPQDGIHALLDTILPVPANGSKPAAQAIVSTEREYYGPIPECKVLVDLARRVCNTSSYGQRMRERSIDPASIWASPKAKKNQFFARYEQAFLDSQQPLRTDLEYLIEGRDFVDVEIPP